MFKKIINILFDKEEERKAMMDKYNELVIDMLSFNFYKIENLVFNIVIAIGIVSI